MRLPRTASTALVLAALATLPCRDANTSSELQPNDTKDEQSITRPLLNKLYKDLYISDVNLNNNNHKIKANNIHNILSVNYLPSNPEHKEKEPIKIEDISFIQNLTSVEFDKKNGVKKKRSGTVSQVVAVTTEISDQQADDDVRQLMTLPPLVVTRKKKPGEVGSSGPLLNYIFDTYSNAHQHKNEKSRANNSIYAAAAPTVNALVGSTAHLDCKVDALHDKLVSWVRRKNNDDAMELLTTGTQKYTADERYSARFILPDTWRLEIRNVRASDAAHYDCQLSAHPPRTARLTLSVPEVSVRIIDGAGASVSEQVCEVGSTVALRCEVKGIRMEGGPALLWFRKTDLLNDDTTRGGISVKTDLSSNGASSVLRVARVRADDAGQYTCAVSHTPPVKLAPAHVLLHVIKGESLAELQSRAITASLHFTLIFYTMIVNVILYLYLKPNN